MLNESPMFETFIEEVYTISEDNGSVKEVDKPKKTVPQNLTPVTIMVVDIISSVRSRPNWYSPKSININNDEDILCYTKSGDNPANWKIALPEALVKPTIKWYH